MMACRSHGRSCFVAVRHFAVVLDDMECMMERMARDYGRLAHSRRMGGRNRSAENMQHDEQNRQNRRPTSSHSAPDVRVRSPSQLKSTWVEVDHTAV